MLNHTAAELEILQDSVKVIIELLDGSGLAVGMRVFVVLLR